MKAEELADKIEDRSRFGCETEEQATKRHILACKAAAAELRRLDALEQAITDPENQPSQYGTITLDEHEKKVSAITEKYSDAVDRFVKEREKVFALEQAAEPVAAPAGHFFVNDYGRWEESSSGVGTPLYTHPAPRKPMTDAQRRRVIDEAGFNTEGLTQDDFAQEIISGTERFHQIKEQP